MKKKQAKEKIGKKPAVCPDCEGRGGDLGPCGNCGGEGSPRVEGGKIGKKLAATVDPIPTCAVCGVRGPCRHDRAPAGHESHKGRELSARLQDGEDEADLNCGCILTRDDDGSGAALFKCAACNAAPALLAIVRETAKGPSLCITRDCGDCTVCRAVAAVARVEGC